MFVSSGSGMMFSSAAKSERIARGLGRIDVAFSSAARWAEPKRSWQRVCPHMLVPGGEQVLIDGLLPKLVRN
jgi:hypothetical protein